MGKTNFTFVRPFLMVLLAFFGMQSLSAQDCNVLIANSATYTVPNCEQGATVPYSFYVLDSQFDDCFSSNFTPNELLFDTDGVLAAAGITATLDNVGGDDTETGGEESVLVGYLLSGLNASNAGEYTITIAYDTDGDGDDQDEPQVEVKITVLAQQPTTDYEDLSCTGTVNIKLNQYCEANLRASQLLNGALVCDDDFDVHVVYVEGNRSYINEDGHISDPFIYHQNGGTYEKNLDKACIQYIYRVYYEGDLVCWGYVNAEDKSAPIFEYCPSDKFYGQRS
ncbi:MAG: hypothetical protein SFU99_02035, partial [Saprospiraceae bacterium]|nr:hypothetical protein [Saprospiraceae bacterium]